MRGPGRSLGTSGRCRARLRLLLSETGRGRRWDAGPLLGTADLGAGPDLGAAVGLGATVLGAGAGLLCRAFEAGFGTAGFGAVALGFAALPLPGAAAGLRLAGLLSTGLALPAGFRLGA